MPIEHTVKSGECISSIADQYGFFPDTVWNHSGNATLKTKRKDPNLLLPGDLVVIPDKQLKTVDKPPEQKHRFRKKGVPALLRLQIFDGETLRSDQSYTLTVDGKIHRGTTDGDGILEVEIPPDAKEADLTIGPDEFRVHLELGRVPPADELQGVLTRLNNLGYDCGRPEDGLTEQAQEAIKAFQYRYKLEQTGKADAPTKDKLAQLHDDAGGLPEGPSDGPVEDGPDA